MEQLPKLEPLISNKMLGENMDVYEASLEDNTSHDVTMRLNMTTAYGAGARNVRDIYEPELQRLRSQVEAMRVSGQWIDCREKLPEPGKYLAWQRDIGETVAHYYGPGKGINGWSMASIVSWTFLPATPNTQDPTTQ